MPLAVCPVGALLKAVCVCSGLVTLSTQQALVDQLLQGCGGGLELHSWSLLPHGSGLGKIQKERGRYSKWVKCKG